LVEEAYDILVDAICSGELCPGVRLNQDDIATRLNVSRQPVNSAISILKAQGLVEDTGRRSVMVTRIDPDLFFAIHEYRRVIEPFAVRLAGRDLTDSHRKEAARVLKLGHRAMERGQLPELLQADALFHEMIYGWSGNRVIQASMKTNWHHIRRTMAEVLREPAAARPVWQEHTEIVESLLSGNTEEAALRMERHIDHAWLRQSASFASTSDRLAGKQRPGPQP
jgi:DNA-binding GntR family transcriptional regulator